MKNARTMNELATKARREKDRETRLLTENFVEKEIMPKIEKAAAEGHYRTQVLKNIGETTTRWYIVKNILLEFGYKIENTAGNNYLTISWEIE